jgi:dihydrofolate synthase/folylpolyglutamate synthase
MENARLAMGAALLLRRSGAAVPDAAIAAGLRSVRWPARLEVVHQRPLVVVDGAHNDDSARKLATALPEVFGHRRLLLVLGVSADKDLDAIAAALVPAAAAVILTRSSHPRAAPPEALAEAVRPYLAGDLHVEADVRTALSRALSLSGSDDLVCVTGSLFVAAAARAAFGLGEPD